MEKRQHLVALTVSNFRRLKAFHIEPGPSGVLILTGKNEQGKSSAIDSLCAAFQGERYAPKAPIHRGADKAEIIAETEDFVVTRSFTTKGTAVIIRDAETADGVKRQRYSSPQALLDKFYNFAGFDLQAFSRMTEKDRTAKLLEICPVDIDLEANRAAEAKAYGARTLLARDLKQAQAALKEAPAVEGAPEQEVSVAALSDEMAVLQEQGITLEREKAGIDALASRVLNREAEAARLSNLIEEGAENLKEARSKVATLPDPTEDIARARQAIDTAESQNVLYRKAEAHKSASASVAQAEKRHEKADQKVVKVRSERADALKRAEFPVETMELSEESVVMYKGIPFSEASTSEQIKVGIALAVHANPNLRLAFVREGHALDSESMAMLDEQAQANDLLVLMERVEDDNPAAIEIVDGCTQEVPDEES